MILGEIVIKINIYLNIHYPYTFSVYSLCIFQECGPTGFSFEILTVKIFLHIS